MSYNSCGQGITALIPGKGVCNTVYINLMSAAPSSESAPNWLNDPALIIRAIDKLIGGKRQVELDSKANIAVTIAEIDSKNIAVQLFSYAESLSEKIDIKINIPVNSGECTLYRFRHAPQKINLRPENNLRILDFQRHAALIFERND